MSDLGLGFALGNMLGNCHSESEEQEKNSEPSLIEYFKGFTFMEWFIFIVRLFIVIVLIWISIPMIKVLLGFV